MTHVEPVRIERTEKRLYTVAELAAMCDVHPSGIRRLVAKNLIRAVRVWRSVRIPADEVERVLRDGVPRQVG